MKSLIKSRIKVSACVRTVLVCLCAMTVLTYFLWVPEVDAYLESVLKIQSDISPWIYTFAALVAAGVLFIFIYSFRFPSAMDRDTVFTPDTARYLKIVTAVLRGECVALILCATCLFALGERLLSPVAAVVSILGMTVSFALRVLSSYVRRAATLQEEVDCTL